MTLLNVALADLRKRRSEKWTAHHSDVLPMDAAELDVELARPIRRALSLALNLGDTGLPGDPRVTIATLAGFALERWGWLLPDDRVVVVPDVAAGLLGTLRHLVGPGDEVAVVGPGRPHSRAWIEATGARAIEVAPRQGRMDLEGIGSALDQGARVVLLANPHHPSGTVPTAEELTRLAELVEGHGGCVVSDESYAPLVYPGVRFTPYASVSPVADEHAVTLTGAGESFNIAGLACAFLIAGQRHAQRLLDRPEEFFGKPGSFGLLGAEAAFGQCGHWLDELRGELAERAGMLGSLLGEQLPDAGYQVPQFGNLAWIDLSAYTDQPDPAAEILVKTRLALRSGTDFGSLGEGHVRLNFGCSEKLLRGGVGRLSANYL